MFSTLQKITHSDVPYTDDSLLQSDNYESCVHNVEDTVSLMDTLMTIHPDKSVNVPIQCIEFVGFLISSVDLTVWLTHKNATNIKAHCNFLLHQK